MLTWSTSATGQTPSFIKNNGSKEAEKLLESWDSAVYDGKSTGDAELDKEAELWRAKFVHLRIVGSNCHPITRQKQQKTNMNHSKSAYTVREKPRDFSLPRIGK